MKRILFAGAGLLALTTCSATAADLGRGAPYGAAPAYIAAPLYDWTGFYLGLNAGGGWGTSSWDSTSAPTGDFDVSGGLIGITGGYNWQFYQWVFGVEGDVDWTNIKGSTTVNCPLGCETSNSWLSTIRGRVGYSWDRFLPYFTAGVAFSDIKASSPNRAGGSSSEAGWVVGAGVEYGITRNWTAKVEYLYADIGSFDCGTACGATAPDNINFRTSILRGGVNFRF